MLTFSKKLIQEYHLSVKQIGSRSDPGLIWVQSVCKGYEIMVPITYASSEGTDEPVHPQKIANALTANSPHTREGM